MIKQKYQPGDVVDFYVRTVYDSNRNLVEETRTGIITAVRLWPYSNDWEYTLIYFPNWGDTKLYQSESTALRIERCIHGYASDSNMAFFKIKFGVG